MTEHQTMAATPHAELIAELMNPNIPKNEREHAAVREIERLREALAQPNTDMAYTIALQRAIEWHCDGKAVPPDVAEVCPYHAEMLNKNLAQPEQDCVGWFGYDTGLRLWFEANKGDDGAISLYTAPPQRQPLTESMIKAGLDELEAIRQTELVGDYELIKRLLIAAHGIGDKT